MKQKGFAHLLLIVLILTGIGLTVYLVSQRTNLTPHAASNGCYSDSQCATGEKCKRYENYLGQCMDPNLNCPQYIAHACDPNANICAYFPNPCYVSPGWTLTPATPTPEELLNGLIAYWGLDGGNISDKNSRNILIDSKSGNNGTATGTTSVVGKISPARSFSNNGDLIQTSPVSLNLTDMTTGAWIQIQDTNTSGIMEIVAQQANINNNNIFDWSLAIQGPNNKLAYGSTGCNWVSYGGTESTTSVGKGWHHVAATRNGTDGKVALYIDGEPVATKVFTGQPGKGPICNNPPLPVSIGGLPGFPQFNFLGNIDEVAIWSRVLSPADIKTLSSQTSSLLPHPLF